MQQTTFGSILGMLLINFCLLFAVTGQTMAQNNNNSNAPGETVQHIPFYNGITIGTDIYGIGGKVLGSDFMSAEVSVAANLKNRFFPVIELGYGMTDTQNDLNIHYKGSSPYFKLGLNYNTMYKKNNAGFLYVGLRYAYSPMTFDVTTMWDPEGNHNPNPSDEIWDTRTDEFNRTGMKSNMHWAEFLVGVQVRIYRSFHMGWSVRMKYRLKISTDEHGDPWYVPGFGKYNSSTLGLTYSLIYELPF